MTRPTVGVITVAAVLLAGCDAEVAGSGKLGERSLDVPDFTRVEVGHGFRAEVSLGPKAVTVRGDDNLIGMISPLVLSGRLELRVNRTFNVRPVHPITVVIRTPELEELGASGGSSVEAALRPAKAITLAADGGSSLRATGLDAEDLGLEASGGAAIEATGRARRVDVTMEGGATVKATGLDAEAVEVSASGGARGEVTATASIRGDLSGGSTLRVSGGPRLRAVNDSGGSRVSYGE